MDYCNVVHKEAVMCKPRHQRKSRVTEVINNIKKEELGNVK
jgi:hypothetical protein